MKTVVITGSARGLGLEMAKVFRQNNVNVVISDLNEEKVEKTQKLIEIDAELQKSRADKDVSSAKLAK